MRLQTAIALSRESSQDYIAAAVSWFKHQEPTFTTWGMTLDSMKAKLPAVVFIHGDQLVSTVNAACNRTVEKLLINRLIVPNNPPQIELLVKPSLGKYNFVLPHTKVAKHWLLNAAQRALDAWLQGER